MTDQKEDKQDQTPTQAPQPKPDTAQETPVSDKGVTDTTGTHGRPSDDSDPGHS